MKSLSKFSLKLLICCGAASLAAQALLIGFSYLTPIRFQAEVFTTVQQDLFFTPASEMRFPVLVQFKKKFTIPSGEWQTVSVAIPRHWASKLRLGFTEYDETLTFRNITLNGQPFNLLNNLHDQTRNIRFCNLAQDTGEITCRIGGERAYMTFPSDETQAALHQTALKRSHVVFFILSLLVSFILYNRYQHKVVLFLSKTYPDWLIIVLFSITFYSYCAMRWYAFLPRLKAVFFTAQWQEFIILIQKQVWAPAVLFAMIALGFTLRNKCYKGLVLLGSFIVLFTEILDSALLYLLNLRFSPEQIVEYGADTLPSIGLFAKSYLSGPAGIYTLLLLGSWSVICIYMWKSHVGKQLKHACIVFALFGLIWYLLPFNLMFNETTQLDDWPRLWLKDKILSAVSGTRPAGSDFQLTYRCQEGLNTQKNIIIIVIESLSPYMSAYFSNGKFENWTPQLDKLAKKYTALKNYRSTGPDTTQSLFGILTGIPAVYFFSESDLYREPKFYQHTLPKAFRRAGYHTVFFTPAAWVYSKDYILKNIGFDQISKDTDPFYDSKKRFIFHSVSDDVLYENVEQWIANYKEPNPYLLVLETATTHNPFVHPKTGEESLQKAFRYADQALADFIEHLKEKKLLDNTVVVITSDHRIPLPLPSQEEMNVLGPDTQALVPMVIIGAPAKVNTEVTTSHIDLWPSLEYLTLPQACFHPYQQNMFSTDKTRSSCTFFLSFEEKHTVFVNCQGKRAKIKVIPLENQIKESEIPSEKQDSVLSFINWIRDNNRY